MQIQTQEIRDNMNTKPIIKQKQKQNKKKNKKHSENADTSTSVTFDPEL